jgi:hypothetical protein
MQSAFKIPSSVTMATGDLGIKKQILSPLLQPLSRSNRARRLLASSNWE